MAIPNYHRNTYIHEHDWLKVTRPDKSVVYIRIAATNHTSGGTANNPNHNAQNLYSDTFTVDLVNTYNNTKHQLDWHNCYSFGNGVESNRIGDGFNTIKLTPGVRVSTVFEDYKEEHRKYGMIYSGIYNSNSGVNNLNQFIQAEKITKDINPTHGSIQKLHTRDTDLIALCEDKVLRIMANKDALYNADGNPQLIATQNVLGQAIPFVGEYGISKNPESFVAEAYRSYFTDKQRGAVMRLSKDGLTAISMHGMTDWFRENLSTSRTNLLGEDNFRSNNRDSWDFTGFTDHDDSNVYMSRGILTLGYQNELAYDSGDYSHNAFGVTAQIVKPGVLEKGKKYRLSFTILEHSGPTREHHGRPARIYINKGFGNGWSSVQSRESESPGRVMYEWVSETTDLCIGQFHLNTDGYYYDGDPSTGTTDASGNPVTTVQEYIGNLRGETSPNFTGPAMERFNGAVCKITDISLEEVKNQEHIIGSYDDKLDEYNLTIRGETPKTLTFREDVKGWVSFKSFIPESGLSCANDYYTVKNGRLWQHHVKGVGRNTFYGGWGGNTTIDVLLNDIPSSVKNFYTLDYTGSRSKIIGAKRVKVINNIYHNSGTVQDIDGRYFYISTDDLETLIEITNPNRRIGDAWVIDHHIRQYRMVNGQLLLIKEGLARLWRIGRDNPTNISANNESRIHGRWDDLDPGEGRGDWEVGDIITTELQERSVDHFYSTPKSGWFVSDVKTDLEEGRLPEFIKKEGKYFNYLKGDNFKTADFDNDGITNFADNNDWATESLQGIGIIKNIETITEDSTQRRKLYFGNDELNASLVIGRRVWCENPTKQLGPELITNKDFTDDANGWTFSSDDGTAHGYTWNSSGYIERGTNGGANSRIRQTVPVVANKTYVLRYDKKWISGNGLTRFFLSQDLSNTSGSYVMVGSLDEDSGNWVTAEDTFTPTVSGDLNLMLYMHAGGQGLLDNISMRELEPGGGFGATIIESRNIVEIGRVIDIGRDARKDYGNYITLHQDVAGLPGEYVLFTNNPIVNSSSLKGYYAKVKLENDSRAKSELFEIGSEISESSK